MLEHYYCVQKYVTFLAGSEYPEMIVIKVLKRLNCCRTPSLVQPASRWLRETTPNRDNLLWSRWNLLLHGSCGSWMTHLLQHFYD